MKSYTDLSQSKKLAEILPIGTADFHFKYYSVLEGWCDIPHYRTASHIKDLPCWSLSALLNVIPKELEIEGQRYAPCLFPVQNKWLLRLWYNANYTITSPIAIFGDNPIDAYYEMVLKLKERNLI